MLTRRLQILLDEERYARLAAQAARTNLSVAAVVRDAIDTAFPTDADGREAAAQALLSAPQMDAPEPDELKAELDQIRAGRR